MNQRGIRDYPLFGTVDAGLRGRLLLVRVAGCEARAGAKAMAACAAFRAESRSTILRTTKCEKEIVEHDKKRFIAASVNSIHATDPNRVKIIQQP